MRKLCLLTIGKLCLLTIALALIVMPLAIVNSSSSGSNSSGSNSSGSNSSGSVCYICQNGPDVTHYNYYRVLVQCPDCDGEWYESDGSEENGETQCQVVTRPDVEEELCPSCQPGCDFCDKGPEGTHYDYVYVTVVCSVCEDDWIEFEGYRENSDSECNVVTDPDRSDVCNLCSKCWICGKLGSEEHHEYVFQRQNCSAFISRHCLRSQRKLIRVTPTSYSSCYETDSDTEGEFVCVYCTVYRDD